MSRDKDQKLSDALAAYQGERAARSEALKRIEELGERLQEAEGEIGRLMMELKRLQDEREWILPFDEK